MTQGLCLDAGALVAIERSDRRLLQLLELTNERGLALDVPTGVLAQVWRGGRRQALLARFLHLPEVRFVDLDVTTARAVGELCALTGASDVVDAHVALHALRLGLSVVTSDPADFEPYTDLAVIAV